MCFHASRVDAEDRAAACLQRDSAMAELHVNMRAEHEAGLAFIAAFFKEVRLPLPLDGVPVCS